MRGIAGPEEAAAPGDRGLPLPAVAAVVALRSGAGGVVLVAAVALLLSVGACDALGALLAEGTSEGVVSAEGCARSEAVLGWDARSLSVMPPPMPASATTPIKMGIHAVRAGDLSGAAVCALPSCGSTERWVPGANMSWWARPSGVVGASSGPCGYGREGGPKGTVEGSALNTGALWGAELRGAALGAICAGVVGSTEGSLGPLPDRDAAAAG